MPLSYAFYMPSLSLSRTIVGIIEWCRGRGRDRGFYRDWKKWGARRNDDEV